MMNTELQQLGGSPHHSAASIIAAALNCTSASNSPPELFSLTTTSSSQLGNPFSPGIAQIAAAASPLNSAAAAVQQLANAHQLAAAIYNNSIPSPGGSAFASRQQQPQAPSAVTVAAAAAMAQQLANQQQQQQQAAAIATIQSQFGGPASPAAAAFAQQLARLHTIANNSNVGANSLDISAQQQQQIAHQMLTSNGAPSNAGLDSLLSNQIQQQTQLLESAANLLANIHQQNPPPPPPQTHQTISHQQHQLIAAALQQQQSIQLQQQQQQQQAAALQAEQSQQIQAALLQQQRNVYGLNSGGIAREEVQSRQQLNSSSSSSSSSAQMPSTAVEQPVAATSAKSASAATTSEGGSVRRIRRRRPKEEAAAAAASQQRRNSVNNGQKPVPVHKLEDSPGSSMGPSSVQQPTTPASVDLMNVAKMEGNEESESTFQPFALQRRMLVTPINNNMAAFNPHQFGPQTPMFSNDGSPPSLLETKQQQREMRRESLEDVDGAGRTKTCKVCGDSATGYNFNVISCESCKAFFRRNALRPKEFKCPYANECEITNVSRRFCQKCRLRKCFEVGMKKEWILSDDQLKRRKNARIKGQLSKDGGNGPRTPSSNGSMAPATPSFGSGMPSSVSTAFSPPQQQQQPHFQHHSPQLQQQSQQQQNHQFAVAAAALLQQQGGQEPSPLALAAAAAINKLAASPKQLSPGGSSILGTLDTSPLASSAFCPLGNSPPEANKLNALNMTGGSMEQQKVSPSGAHSPPPILPALQQANGGHQQQQQHYDPAILRVAQQQLLQQAHLQQAAAAFAAQQQQQQQRRPSDGLLSLSPAAALLGAAQQQQMSPNGSNISASLIEQYKLMMKLGQQQQQQQAHQPQINDDPRGLLNVRTPPTVSPYRPNELMSPRNPSTPGTGDMPSSTTQTPSFGSITSMPAGAAGMMASFTQEQIEQYKKLQMQGGAMPSFTQEQIEQYKKMQMQGGGAMPSYSQEMRELFMQQQIQKTINEELGMAQSPPETARSSPGVPSTPDAVLAEAETKHEEALQRQRKQTITRQYQLNSLEQCQMDAVKSAFASMDEELTRELLNNKKLHGLMTQEQTQSPIDMICLLDVVMRRFVKLAKRLPSFNELSAGGKFSLLKAAMMDLLTLRGASRLDTQKRCWKSPLLNTEIKCKIDMFDQLNDSEQKRRVMDFYQSLHDKLKTDQVANNLIVVSVLFIHFTDTELSANDRALAEKYYYGYKHLLERYLQSVYGPEEAKDIYEKVPDALANLKSVTNKVRGLFPRDIDRKETDGTLVQEFDIIAKEGGGEGEAEKKPEGQEEEEKMDVDSSTSGKT